MRFTRALHHVGMSPNGVLVVSVDHPSLDGDVVRFLADLRTESGASGSHAQSRPTPVASLIHELGLRNGLRLGVVQCGRLVGMTRIDERGRLHLAVAADHRGRGLGRLLVEATAERAKTPPCGQIMGLRPRQSTSA